ncbi:MAG: DUF5018 domain-containing protein [Spirochaetaceae bacterium]|jgi:hypothetical protein|nr:DUF5018 domain-containing protein [Spirochaetaceae bacterium]
MKKTNSTIKNIAVFLAVGLLLFSCALSGTEDYGTLVVMLPGGMGATARAAVSNEFTAALRYRLECSGPGGQITGSFNSGGNAAVSLVPGSWTVTVSVLNAAGETIGEGTAAAAISAGETTSIQIPIAIDTSRKDITSFAITSPVSAEGVIDSATITVYVPGETPTTNMDFTLVHTGASVNYSPETRDFSSPKTFTVRAEDSSTKFYTVRMVPALPWPSDTTWETYGLAGLRQPEGTIVSDMDEIDILSIYKKVSVTLKKINDDAYANLRAQIMAELGEPSSQNTGDGIREDEFTNMETFFSFSRRTANLAMDAERNEIIISITGWF